MNNEKYVFEGIIRGEIVMDKRGISGFGYDPIFIPEGYDQTFAELGDNIKMKLAIAHKLLINSANSSNRYNKQVINKL